MQIRNHYLLIILAAAIAVGAVFFFSTMLLRSDNAPAEGAAVNLYSPFGLYGPGTLVALPTSASQTVLNALGLKTLDHFQDYSLALTKELGVNWVRIDFPYDGWNFTEPSAYLNKLHESGIEVVACVLPMNTFVPEDLAAFETTLRSAIERYPWIKVWQIGNEPDLSWDNPDDYPRFFFAAQGVIREECPDCRVALAGAGARWPGQDLEGWHRALEVYDRIIGSIADQAGGDTRPFDIADIHYYDFYGTNDAMLITLREYRELIARHGLDPGIQFWVTECATPTGNLTWPADSPDQTEEQQAAELVTRFVTMLGAQVDRVSWARVYDNYRYHDTEGGFFDHSGLIYNGLGKEAGDGVGAGTRKLGFNTYRVLISKVSGCSHVHRLAADAYRFDFEDNRSPVYVLWNDNHPAELTGPILVTDLSGGTTQTNSDQLVSMPGPVFVEKL